MTDKVQKSSLAEIKRLHSSVMSAAKTTLDNAIRIGELLTKIKSSMPHGGWIKWLEKNAPFSQQTASNYVRVFNNQEQIKAAEISEPGQAYRLLSVKNEPENEPAKLPTVGSLKSENPIESRVSSKSPPAETKPKRTQNPPVLISENEPETEPENTLPEKDIFTFRAFKKAFGDVLSRVDSEAMTLEDQSACAHLVRDFRIEMLNRLADMELPV